MDKLTNEAAVIKIISKSWVLRRNQLSHVFAERDILAHLHHPFVVSFKGSFQDRFCLYLVLEYVQGGELYTRLSQTGCIEAHDAKIYACEVFSALSYLHSKQIAYRDLKPENILLTKTGHIKLVDFGLAKIVVDRTFTLCGTPQYLAPEVISAEGHDMQCDWWALGVLIFEMLTGMTPYQADSPSELFQQILTVEVRFESGFPRDARALIEMLLEKDPKKRATKEQIRNSEYFAGVDWIQVSQSRLRPHYRPKVKNPLDASHFDKYSEEFLLEDIKPTEAVLFADF
jgi:serine/threonine protein kinase